MNQADCIDPDQMARQALNAANAGNAGEAKSLAAQARALGGLGPVALDRLGNALFKAHDIAGAESVFRQSLALDRSATALFNLAATCRALGQLDEAESLYDEVIEARPDAWEAWRNRSELRRQQDSDNHVDALKRAIATATPEGQCRLGFALGKELEDLERFDDAWQAFEAANRLMRRAIRYSVQADLDIMNALMAEAGDAESGTSDAAPIFIVGMPRSGTTLVERILTAHSATVTLGESTAFPAAMSQAARVAGLATASANGIRGFDRITGDVLARGYLVEVARQHDPDAGRTIDKLPLNYLHVALIRRAFPNASIVLLERDPRDLLIALYRTLFMNAYPFAYDVEEAITYLNQYYSLVHHWQQSIPNLVTIGYEKLVQDRESTVRALVDGCGLDWEPACLEPEKLNAPSTTASAVQVREAIHDRSIGQWQRYEEKLGALLARLETKETIK